MDTKGSQSKSGYHEEMKQMSCFDLYHKAYAKHLDSSDTIQIWDAKY